MGVKGGGLCQADMSNVRLVPCLLDAEATSRFCGFQCLQEAVPCFDAGKCLLVDIGPQADRMWQHLMAVEKVVDHPTDITEPPLGH
ncbi:hypothetical protein ACFSUK_13130 [Sphingobium scionense]